MIRILQDMTYKSSIVLGEILSYKYTIQYTHAVGMYKSILSNMFVSFLKNKR